MPYWRVLLLNVIPLVPVICLHWHLVVRQRNCSLHSHLKRIVLRGTSESNTGNFVTLFDKTQNGFMCRSWWSQRPAYWDTTRTCFQISPIILKSLYSLIVWWSQTDVHVLSAASRARTDLLYRHITCRDTRDSTDMSLRTSHMQFDSCWLNLTNWIDDV